jgi:hypothetical protein
MKKIINGMAGVMFSIAASSPSVASMSYECWAYVGGSPDKMVHVTADNNSEAVALAQKKMEDLGIKYDYVKCK